MGNSRGQEQEEQEQEQMQQEEEEQKKKQTQEEQEEKYQEGGKRVRGAHDACMSNLASMAVSTSPKKSIAVVPSRLTRTLSSPVLRTTTTPQTERVSRGYRYVGERRFARDVLQILAGKPRMGFDVDFESGFQKPTARKLPRQQPGPEEG
eukprot:COSAG04_NODE_81_length_27945_cov_46.142821_17_plen_150_part_00